MFGKRLVVMRDALEMSLGYCAALPDAFIRVADAAAVVGTACRGVARSRSGGGGSGNSCAELSAEYREKALHELFTDISISGIEDTECGTAVAVASVIPIDGTWGGARVDCEFTIDEEDEGNNGRTKPRSAECG